MKIRPTTASAVLLVLLVAASLLALSVGALKLPLPRLLAIATGEQATPREAVVLWQIRAPRILTAISVGAALGLAGAAQQGLFRNPLADPALIGVSAGAAFAAVGVIVLGQHLPQIPFLVPMAAFVGALIASTAAFRLAHAGGQTSGAAGSLLLAGIAVNAIAGAGTGLLITLSDDRQLRDITFWTMGSLAAGGWPGVLIVTFALGLALALLLPTTQALDALLLGEAEAAYAGVNLQRLQKLVVGATALAIGASVAICGIIGFVGLVVPHLVRGFVGGQHKAVLPVSALTGAVLMLLADAGARTIAAPAELPVGLLTSLIGGPFFLALLIRRGMAA